MKQQANRIDMRALPEMQRQQLEYLHQTAEKAHAAEEEWLSRLHQAMITLLSIAAPLALATGSKGTPRFFLLASLLSALLAVITGAVRLHALKRTAECTLEAVAEDTKNLRFLVGAATPLSRTEKWCGRCLEAFAALSALLLLLAICFAFGSS